MVGFHMAGFGPDSLIIQDLYSASNINHPGRLPYKMGKEGE
jgi:hypothetical protein